MQIEALARVRKRSKSGEWHVDGFVTLMLVRDSQHRFSCDIDTPLHMFLQGSRAETGFYAVGDALFIYTGPVVVPLLDGIEAQLDRTDGRIRPGAFVKFAAPNGSFGVVLGDSGEGYAVRWYYGKDVKGEPMTGSAHCGSRTLAPITMEEFNEIAGRKGWGDSKGT